MRIILLVALWITAYTLNAQTFAVDTVLRNGKVAERINLVFLGDGYTAAEQDKFITDVNKILTALFAQTPFKEYKTYFNAYAVKVISAQSGANHPKTSADSDCTTPVAVVNNYFGSTFDYNGIHRLLYPTKLSTVMNTLVAHFPTFKQGFVVVNSPYYGGAGGAFATCSDHPSGREVALHEIGHSFAGLADEYWAGDNYAFEKPNMTQQTNPAVVKWKNWMGVNGIGIYSHSVKPEWKKPHLECKMQYLNKPFCSVCIETFIEEFHTIVNPITGSLPAVKKINLEADAEMQLDFSVSVLAPTPNTVKITWQQNGVTVLKNETSFSVSSTTLPGKSAVQVLVMDTTRLTRSDNHTSLHVYVLKWEITKGLVTEIEPQPQQEYKLEVFPNPSGNELKFSYTLPRAEDVQVRITDLNGKVVRTLLSTQQPAGMYTYGFLRTDLAVPPSAYMMEFSFSGVVIPVRVVLTP